MDDDELTRLGAEQLARLIRERRASSLEVVEAHLRRIEQENPRLNAVVTLDPEGALRAARERDARRARGDDLGPLHGVPLTLKDCHETAGLRTTAGAEVWSEHIPQCDSVVVAKLRVAGAVVLGKTNVPTLLGDMQCDNPIFGRTSNPWDTARTSGGSSGGAAAALAAGMTPLEFGSDVGGSIRIPSHCCGTFGLKPTEGRVSNHGHLPGQFGSFRDAWCMNVIGPMARTIDDLELGFRVIAGPDARDPGTLPFPAGEIPTLELRGLRIAWTATFPGLPIASDISQAIEGLATLLEQAGATVDNALPAGLDWEDQTATRHTLREAMRAPATMAEVAQALEARARFQAAWDVFLSGWDALLAPVMLTTAIHHCPRGTPVEVDGQPHDYGLLAEHCRPFNLSGHPAVALPIGLDRQGLPIGVQLVGSRWRDERLLGVARAVAAALTPLPPLPTPGRGGDEKPTTGHWSLVTGHSQRG